MRTKAARSMLVVLALPALLVTIAFSATPAAASDTCANATAITNVLLEDRPFDPYRVRCEITQVPDPYGRAGASYEISLFVGFVCPIGQGNEFCFLKGTQPIARTGAHVDDSNLVTVTPGEVFPLAVCLQFIPCIEADVPLSFSLEVFGDSDTDEAQAFIAGGGPGANLPQLCVDVGTQNCTTFVENTDVLSWIRL